MAANYFHLTQRKVFVCATDSFVCTPIISLGSSSFFQSNVKNVGVRFDQALSFNTHINSLVGSCILSVKCCPPQSNGVQVRIRNDNSCFCFLKVVIHLRKSFLDHLQITHCKVQLLIRLSSDLTWHLFCCLCIMYLCDYFQSYAWLNACLH